MTPYPNAPTTLKNTSRACKGDAYLPNIRTPAKEATRLF